MGTRGWEGPFVRLLAHLQRSRHLPQSPYCRLPILSPHTLVMQNRPDIRRAAHQRTDFSRTVERAEVQRLGKVRLVPRLYFVRLGRSTSPVTVKVNGSPVMVANSVPASALIFAHTVSIGGLVCMVHFLYLSAVIRLQKTTACGGKPLHGTLALPHHPLAIREPETRVQSYGDAAQTTRKPL